MSSSVSLQEAQQDRNRRSWILLGGIFCLFSLLITRLFFLQVIQYEANYRRSEKNRMRELVVKAERGHILDRKERVLVRNRPSYQVAVLNEKLGKKGLQREKQRAQLFKDLMTLRNAVGQPLFDSATTHFALERARYRKFTAQRILEDASIEQVSLLEELQSRLPGILTLVESRREYPYGTLAAHVLGYTGEVTEKQLKEEQFSDYSTGDRIGKKGLEKYYEKEFKGENGVRFVEVDAFGRELGLLEGMPHRDPVPGRTLVTTIDFDLQKVAENALSDTVRGAVVALDPRSGEILLMVSTPRIDPNIFSLARGAKNRGWAKVALDSAMPLNNRAVVGIYPPGSVFKFIPAAAGLLSNTITGNSRDYKPCHGAFRLGRRTQRCWKSSGHGRMSVIDALRESCDVYFYQLGLELDMDPINKMARRFGLGKKTGVDLPAEKSGLLMDSLTYNKKFRRLNWKWTKGQILNLSIGQGQLVTPLQIANMFGSIATNGFRYRPHFKKYTKDAEGRIHDFYRPEVIEKISLPSKVHEVLLQGMEEVMTAPGGTGGRARVAGVRVGGKTGSAENPHGEKTHAWFAAAAPLDAPEIAIAVLVENAGHGGSVAAPIAGKILNAYFNQGQSN